MSFYRPLQKCDAKIIQRALPTRAKIYSAARVSLRLSGADHFGGLTLARLKNERTICVFLVLLQGGVHVSWSQPLSSASKLQGYPENPLSYRLYDEVYQHIASGFGSIALTTSTKDTNFNAEVVFEDPSEASRLKGKFARLIERIASGEATPTVETSNPSELLSQSDDATPTVERSNPFEPLSHANVHASALQSQIILEPMIETHLASSPSASSIKSSPSRALIQIPSKTAVPIKSCKSNI